jgi:hypothetical protein
MFQFHRDSTRLATQCMLAATLLAAYHVGLRWLMTHASLQLGAVRPGEKVYRLVPLYAYWAPHFKTGLLTAIALVAVSLWLFRRFVHSGRLPAALVVPMLMIAHVLIAVSVAMVDGGVHRLWRPYELLANTDYIGAVSSVGSPREFLGDYSRQMSTLPLHCQTHPPGGVLALWAVSRLVGSGPVCAAWATILASSLVVPAVYLLAREVVDEHAARLAVCFLILSPSIVMFSATLLDAVFSVPIVWSVYFLWRSRDSRPVLHGTLGGAAAALASMMTFSASFLALWALVVIALTAIADRKRLRPAILGMSAAAISLTVFYAALYLWSGYDSLAVLVEAMAAQKRIMAGRGHDTLQQDVHFAVANLAAFFFCAGIPLTVLWLRHVAGMMKSCDRFSAGHLFSCSFVVALALFDAAPLYTLEVEHIWLFLVPFVAIDAAAVAARHDASVAIRPIAMCALALLAAQTLIMETLLETIW